MVTWGFVHQVDVTCRRYKTTHSPSRGGGENKRDEEHRSECLPYIPTGVVWIRRSRNVESFCDWREKHRPWYGFVGRDAHGTGAADLSSVIDRIGQ